VAASTISVGTEGAKVEVVGLRALRADIRKMSDEYQGPIYDALKAAARTIADPVAARAQSSIHPSGKPKTHWHTPGKMVPKVSLTRTGAGVRMGTSSYPYAPWLEFGGHRKNPHGSDRLVIRTGRYLFPAAYALAPGLAPKYAAALQHVLDDSTLWTNTTNNPQQVTD
jgi:hypothetical protein